MSSSWWREDTFQLRLLRFLSRDRKFLQNVGGMLSAKDFRPGRDETDERYVLATIALDFYKKYRQPIGDMLKPKVAEWIDTNKPSKGDEKRLQKLSHRVGMKKKLIAAQAMEDQVAKYLQKRKMQDSIESLVKKFEDGELTNRNFVDICKEVVQWSGNPKRVVTDILSEDSLRTRIHRRSVEKNQKRPLLMIEGLDTRTKGPGRGDLGLLIALYKMGKSLCLAHIADAYAKQNLNVLYFTLEDPVEEVEDRMDAALVYLPIDKLAELPNRLKKRFRKFSSRISGRIRVVDATSEGVSIADIEGEWERQRDLGFTADVVIVDYDDEIIPPDEKADRRHQFGAIYRQFRQFLSRTQCIGWIASQAKRMDERTKIITGNDSAEDIGKVRKATMAIGIGQGDEHVDARYLYVAAHKRGRAKFGVSIMANPTRGLFYDPALTARIIRKDTSNGTATSTVAKPKPKPGRPRSRDAS